MHGGLRRCFRQCQLRQVNVCGRENASDLQSATIERENARLQRRLARVETMLEIQKRTSELLGIPLNPLESDQND